MLLNITVKLLLGVILLRFGSAATAESEHSAKRGQDERFTEADSLVTTEDSPACEYAPGLSPMPHSNRSKCCNMVYRDFLMKWAYGRRYLSSFLETLRDWKCEEFHQECQKPTFAFNSFTKLMYARFCNHTLLVEKCKTQVADAALGLSNDKEISWDKAIQQLDVLQLTSVDIRNPCIQVAMYERNSGGFGHYHEVVTPLVPFCSFVWCGVDEKLVDGGGISVFSCMPKRCQASIVVMMVFCGVVAVLITFANSTVICTLICKKATRHNQTIYRFSLALADLLVGVFVFPTFISSLSKEVYSSHELAQKNVAGYIMENGTVLPDQKGSYEVRVSVNRFVRDFPASYINFVGIFTALSLLASVFTLVVAAIDRCIALSFSLKYKEHRKIPIALVATVCVWVLAIILSLLPLFVPVLQYTLVASILVASSGEKAVILYSLGFLVPLLIMWLATLFSFIKARRHITRCRHLSTVNSVTNDLSEARLAKTLGVMVGVFTFSLLPAAVVLLTALFIPTIYVTLPLYLHQEDSVTYLSVEVVVLFILMCNSLWNCFIYSVRDKEFRKGALEMYADLSRKMGLSFLERFFNNSVEGRSEHRDRLQNSDSEHLGKTQVTAVTRGLNDDFQKQPSINATSTV